MNVSGVKVDKMFSKFVSILETDYTVKSDQYGSISLFNKQLRSMREHLHFFENFNKKYFSKVT